MHDSEAAIVAESSAWAGWPRAAAEAWTEALLAFERHRMTSTVSPMLLLALWHDWRVRRALPELECWAAMAAAFERHGVGADAFARFHEAAGVPRWSPEADCRNRRCADSAAAGMELGAARTPSSAGPDQRPRG
ncbi:hypothetical protein [Agrococcus sp. HG114]|uniref:hypothetical protein n=1 Tax=Agrococcus sp. HG114 TaxID=2969757 RepID=UPI00215A6D90|nr:hypothetical protein [Agrococcus sp. HG114]MCR8671377.1 hypothetical protein [Agrococcus sp. HG114]